MFQKLLFLFCVLGSASAFAQVAITVPKTTEKPADQKIDYSIVGTPMPPLNFIVYRDTIGKQEKGGAVKDSAVTEKGQRKKGKKHEENPVAKGVNVSVSQDVLTNEDLDNGANLLVMIFNPTCSHCQDETVTIGNNADLFKRSKMLFVAAERQKMYVGDFIKYTRFDQYPFYLGVDDSDKFINKVFLYRSLPQINIYDKHRKLIKVFSGEVAIDSLKQYIQ